MLAAAMCGCSGKSSEESESLPKPETEQETPAGSESSVPEEVGAVEEEKKEEENPAEENAEDYVF